MASEGVARALEDTLFAERRSHVYAVLDGAAAPDLLNDLYRLSPRHECLYRGELQPDMAWVAPYLVRLDRGHSFTELVLEEGWGRSWGIFAVSESEFDAVRTHFRRFLMVHTSEGKPLYFRYYDPRVLREFLPIADAGQVGTMFGLLKAYFVEGFEGNELLKFVVSAGSVEKTVLKLETPGSGR